jgi:regulator of replication initiation timing
MASRAESLEKTVATLGARVDAMLLDLANVAQERNQLRKERDAALAETERLRAHAETIIRRTTDERDAARVERDSARTELRRVYDELGRISGLVELLK